MEDGAKCWVCLRNSDEINSVVGEGAEEKAEQIKSKLLRVTQLKSRFIRSSGAWAALLPPEFDYMEMRFALDNRERFETARVLNEMADARYFVRRLAEASHAVRAGKHVSFGGISLPPTRKGERQLLLSRFEAFDEKVRRAQGAAEDGVDKEGRLIGLDSLSFAEGLEFLREGVVLYFQTQEELLEDELSTALHSIGPQVAFVRLQGLPDVPLCTVCQGLLHKAQAVGNGSQALHQRRTFLSSIRHALSTLVSSERFILALVTVGMAELAVMAMAFLR
jgi:hypothetical protein